jgi:WD40 repeat protein
VAISFVITGSEAGSTSARVVALSEGELTHMLLTKLKLFSLLVVVLAAGAVVVQALRADDPSAGGGAHPSNAMQSGPAPGEPRPRGKAGKVKLLSLPAGTAVDAITWGPDGKILVTQERTWTNPGGEPGKEIVTGHALQVRDARTGEVRKTLLTTDRTGGSLHDAAFSPDGKSLAAIHRDTAGKETVVLVWDTASWKGTKILSTQGFGFLLKVAWSRDGRLLAAAGDAGPMLDGAIFVWDTKTEKLLWAKRMAHGGGVTGLAFSPDGKLLASASGDAMRIKLWDGATGKLEKNLEGNGEGGVYSLAFSRDGLLASGGLDGTVRLWDQKGGKPKQAVKDSFHRGLIVQVDFSPDGRPLAVTGNSAELANITLLFDARNGKLRRTFPEEKGGARAMAFSRDGGTIAVGAWNSRILLLPVND